MANQKLDTLGDLSRHGLLVLFRCPGCGRESRFEPRDMILTIGLSRTIRDIRGACSWCGRRGVRAEINPHSLKPDRPRTATPDGRGKS
ncbi:hypothetical protein GGE65_006238 [Skermanella aerolata]|uniref:hypothetical protein n=1 Tax=Skermanella aerolata TaxID=393310 RepID=UPI003D20C02F